MIALPAIENTKKGSAFNKGHIIEASPFEKVAGLFQYYTEANDSMCPNPVMPFHSQSPIEGRLISIT